MFSVRLNLRSRSVTINKARSAFSFSETRVGLKKQPSIPKLWIREPFRTDIKKTLILKTYRTFMWTDSRLDCEKEEEGKTQIGIYVKTVIIYLKMLRIQKLTKLSIKDVHILQFRFYKIK